MRHGHIFAICFSLLVIAAVAQAAEAPKASSRFRIQGDHFELDGAPFQILAGEMHYSRIPRQYWRDRLKKAKAMGLNTVATYIFWNQHEPRPGVFDFSGDNDVAQFIREAQAEGLYVMLRPGPYSCAEWEFGGYPAWLLKDRSAVLRSSDPKHMAQVKRWLTKLGEQLAPLQLDRGGPIVTVQLENEYGAVAKDPTYLEELKNLLVASGFSDALMHTVNPDWALEGGSVDGVLPMVNFGTGAAQNAFAKLATTLPGGPLMAGEFWTGWFDYWGFKHHVTDVTQELADLGWILSKGYSFNLYVLHGGTSFGWMNGATVENDVYQSNVTSYDYGAPLDESGRLTSTFWSIRDLIAKETHQTLSDPPADAPVISIPEFSASGALPLWDALPKPIQSLRPLTMEDVDQAYGYILYRKTIRGPIKGDLILKGLHDYAEIYLDGKKVGTIETRLMQDRLNLQSLKKSATLDILVENSSRANYGDVMRQQRKGLTDKVTWAGRELTDWKIYPLPLDGITKLKYGRGRCAGACFFEAKFNVEEPADSFLKTDKLGKGIVFVNGRPLGRFWSRLGPQKTLFLPGPWLKKGVNTINIFDLNATPDWKMEGGDKPILDGDVPPSQSAGA